MLSALGFVDTAAVYGPAVYGPPNQNTLADQYAAMPSLHIGWAVMVALGIIATTRSRWRWLAVLHPVAHHAGRDRHRQPLLAGRDGRGSACWPRRWSWCAASASRASTCRTSCRCSPRRPSGSCPTCPTGCRRRSAGRCGSTARCWRTRRWPSAPHARLTSVRPASRPSTRTADPRLLRPPGRRPRARPVDPRPTSPAAVPARHVARARTSRPATPARPGPHVPGPRVHAHDPRTDARGPSGPRPGGPRAGVATRAAGPRHARSEPRIWPM